MVVVVEKSDVDSADLYVLDNNNTISRISISITILSFFAVNFFRTPRKQDIPMKFEYVMPFFTYLCTVSPAFAIGRRSTRSLYNVVRWCQLSAPDTITTSSPGNTLRVVFSSDWSVTYQGFSASYIAYDPYSGN